MTCTKHVFNVRWEHHHWRPHVLSTEYVPTLDTNMWGRVVKSDFVRCRKEFVCEVCGKTQPDINCVCDKEEGECCAVRLACLAAAQ